jgi:hypothetical protein
MRFSIRFVLASPQAFRLPGLFSLLCLFSMLGAVAASSRCSAEEPLSFAVIGDIPYDEDEFPLLRRQIDELAPPPAFLLHVGDIKRSTVPFRELDYRRVADELNRSKIPVFITPGDNEYNDAADPALAWSYWVKYFGKYPEPWKHGLDVRRQKERPENVAFVHRDVLFVMVNLVGGRLQSRQEWSDRMDDDAHWIEDAFGREGERVRGAVVVGHAHPVGPRQPFAEVFIPTAARFAKPVLYLHGDGHRWIHNRPFAAAPNLLRVQIDQGGIAPPLRVTVAEPGADGDFFTFDRGLTDEYNQRRTAYDAKERERRTANARKAAETAKKDGNK